MGATTKGIQHSNGSTRHDLLFLIYLRHMDKQVLNPANTKAASNM